MFIFILPGAPQVRSGVQAGILRCAAAPGAAPAPAASPAPAAPPARAPASPAAPATPAAPADGQPTATCKYNQGIWR